MLPIGDRFVKDPPQSGGSTGSRQNIIPDSIAGCSAIPLAASGDDRGFLIELLSERERLAELIVHVYQVHASPHSVRAWVYHRLQTDRLAYTMGRFRVVLYDLRTDSPTCGRINELLVGADNRVLLTIPPFVAHGVQNLEATTSSFVNLPTKVYDLAAPDKCRLPHTSGLIPFDFGPTPE